METAKKAEKPHMIKDLMASLAMVYKDACGYDKRFVWVTIAYVILDALSPLGLVFIPPIAVGFVSQGIADGFSQAAIVNFVWVVSALSIGTVLAQYLRSVAFGYLEMRNTEVRLSIGWRRLMEKADRLDYCLFEPKGANLKLANASQALQSNWNGYERLLKETPPFLSAFLGSVIYAAWTIAISPWVFLCLVAMAAVHMGLTAYSNRKSAAIDKAELDDSWKVENYYKSETKDPVAGKDIRNYNLQSLLIQKQAKANRRYNSLLVMENLLFALPASVDSIIMAGVNVLAYFFVVGMYLDGMVTASDMVLLIGIVTGFAGFVTVWTNSLTQMVNASRIIAKYISFLKTPNVMTHEGGKDPKDFQGKWEIVLDHVWFKYPESQDWILRDVNLTIKAGERLALVGVNGAGKTTLVKLLSGLYYPSKGDIKINGVSIKDLNIDGYHAMLSVINQSTSPFPFSVKENVVPGSQPFDKDRFDAVLKEADVYDDVMALPKKEDTYLTAAYDPKGVMLSGGQIQKLLLARALYRNGRLLILDEPTAALDPLAESKLYGEYQSLTSDNTSVFISHRLASTRFCDWIVMMAKGKIVEEGTHESLLAQNGPYAEMFRVQAHYYRDSAEKEEA